MHDSFSWLVWVLECLFEDAPLAHARVCAFAFFQRSYLALVCLMQAEHFNNKEGLIEYNVNCFKQTLAQVFKRPPLRVVS